MPIFHKILSAALVAFAATAPAHAETATAGWNWLAATNEIQTEGLIWNDSFGDGKDRWKTGGITQSYVFPERIFSEESWLPGRASSCPSSTITTTSAKIFASAVVNPPRPPSNGAAVAL